MSKVPNNIKNISNTDYMHNNITWIQASQYLS